MEGSTLFNFSAVSLIFMFWGWKMSMGCLYLKGPDSKNSKYRQARTPLGRFPIGRPDFCLWNLLLKNDY